MKSVIEKLAFKCTDRLKETKTYELKVSDDNEANDSSSAKSYNQILLEKLKVFQKDVNSIMTELVDKEKEAIANKKLSNDHINDKAKNKKQDENDEGDDDDDDDEDDDEDEASDAGDDNLDANLKANTDSSNSNLSKRSSDINDQVLVESNKKVCL